MSTTTKTEIREPIGVMWKTVSESCNLACDYCYYSTCGGKPGKIDRIDPDVLEKFIAEYMAMSRGAASFAWQGGEPLLAGLDFFEEVVTLQAKHAPPHTAISNALQTNGTLITDRFAQFFKTYRFLIGVSVDGPKHIHDMRRVDASGKGSHERVMQGLSILRKHGVEFNVLTVIHENNVGQAKELFAFYEQEGIDFVQFIPCMSFQSQRVDQPGEYAVTPQQYGEFLCEAFDFWYNEGQPHMSIRFFDNMLSVYAHREAEACIHRQRCGKTLVLEQNGDAYPCDFYIHSDWKLGNVGSDSLQDILAHPLYDSFLHMKPNLPEHCKSCPWLHLCYGGCPRNRKWDEFRTQSSRDYFCESYQQVYAYAHERMTLLATNIRKQLFRQGLGRTIDLHFPRRNDPCPCGSGRKFKHCCRDLQRS